MRLEGIVDDGPHWAENALARAVQIAPTEDQRTLADELIALAYAYAGSSGKSVGVCLAAAFDLMVAAEYYQRVANRGWCYCPSERSRLVYPFTNTCPICILNASFHHHPANKPESGQIGQVTTNLLCVFLDRLFAKEGKKLSVLRGKEPVDVLVYDAAENTVLLAEVKAAPLLTLALAADAEKLTEMVDDQMRELPHGPVDNSSLTTSRLKITLPQYENGAWISSFYDIAHNWRAGDGSWAYKGILGLLQQNSDFFGKFSDFWHLAFDAYESRDVANPIFWLTNACGQPSPRPVGWPDRQKGLGYESVSDGKTSVGMDRTDDIKKGIYQVLKLGSEAKPANSRMLVKTALLSNIHAARHYTEYLDSLEDIVWTLDSTGTAMKVGDLDEGLPVYNLFDGIISFTRNVARDSWIRRNFEF